MMIVECHESASKLNVKIERNLCGQMERHHESI